MLTIILVQQPMQTAEGNGGGDAPFHQFCVQILQRVRGKWII
jgi:hypothetical protein